MSIKNNLEIEKKYLISVEELPFSLENLEKLSIEQGYISTRPTIRIRKSDEDYILTVKTKNGIKNVDDTKINKELETFIDWEEYESLLNLVNRQKTRILSKNRYIRKLENGLLAEIDEFLGEYKGIYIAEVEFKSLEEAENFEKPNWFGCEVSSKDEFSNAYMAKCENPEDILSYYNNNK